MEHIHNNEDDTNYKRFHESYMINLNGTSAFETYTLFVPSFLTVLISNLIFIILSLLAFKQTKLTQFLIEFLILVIPIVVWVTILSDYVKHIFLLLFCSAIFLILWLLRYATYCNISNLQLLNTRRHCITNARTTINLITGICILAVDFRIFPRRFAKTETLGFSLMDVGVGLYVFSNGIVAMPHTRAETGGFLASLYKTFVSCIPLFILGSVRFILTNELDYQMHVSEYGVHWNFFITLAVTKMLSSCVLAAINKDAVPYITCAIIFIHQCLLSNGLEDWVFSDVKRSNFVLANREGLASALGYVGLYFQSISVAHFMNLKGKTTFTANLRLLLEMFLLSVVILFLMVLTEDTFGVSRRLANVGYCFWIIFIGTSMTTLFLAIELFVIYLQECVKQFCETKKMYVLKSDLTPLIYDAINFNGLTFFLLANVLTGLINLTMQTLTIAPFQSLIIIILYIFLICAIMSATFVQNIKLKFW